ncbi:hypothetical protein COLO4_01086 [Corchorus olitorius]|uniref:Uncharacterized protein n=1 Tax=Corchorus olitorius TaxID=93759 RepID=A0A1R3L317_9ROSI|nr:hypothetical protein COLO4_01086 [Corchorus olitorius]
MAKKGQLHFQFKEKQLLLRQCLFKFHLETFKGQLSTLTTGPLPKKT